MFLIFKFLEESVLSVVYMSDFITLGGASLFFMLSGANARDEGKGAQVPRKW